MYDSNWYGWLQKALHNPAAGVEAFLNNMPDPVGARESIWLPYMHDKLQCGPDTIIVGHSSGAAAGMRYAEKYGVLGGRGGGCGGGVGPCFCAGGLKVMSSRRFLLP